MEMWVYHCPSYFLETSSADHCKRKVKAVNKVPNPPVGIYPIQVDGSLPQCMDVANGERRLLGSAVRLPGLQHPQSSGMWWLGSGNQRKSCYAPSSFEVSAKVWKQAVLVLTSIRRSIEPNATSQCLHHLCHFISSWRDLTFSHHHKKGEDRTIKFNVEREHIHIGFITAYCYNYSFIINC